MKYLLLLCCFVACTPIEPNDGELIMHKESKAPSRFQHSLSLGIVPQQSPADIERRWGPLSEYIEAETGIKVYIKTTTSIPMFEKRCLESRYDLSYMNPYHYVVFSKTPGYRAIAKQKNKQIKGIMVMRKDRPDHSLTSLHQHELAFPSPAAFAASLLTRAHLKSINVAFDPVYVRSHDSVYRAVAEGLYAAGGGVKRTFASTDPTVRERLKIAWTTHPFTPHALAVHPRVPRHVVSKIQHALLKLDSKERFPKILKPIHFKGFIGAEHSDWDDVKALGLTELTKPNR